MAYICWGTHGEELDGRVRDAVAAAAQVVVAAHALARLGQGAPWRVAVECTEKHVNVFAGRGPVPLPLPAGADVIGEVPNAGDLLLQKAAGTLGLSDSLARVEATAKYVIGLVSTVSLLTTAFGAWSATASTNAGLALSTALLAAASVACGVGAVTPRLAKVAPANLAAVQASLEKSLVTRVWLVRASGMLLAAALACAPFVREAPPAKAPSGATGGP